MSLLERPHLYCHPFKDAMKSCGATLIDSLTYRGSYALIGLKDGFSALGWRASRNQKENMKGMCDISVYIDMSCLYNYTYI